MWVISPNRPLELSYFLYKYILNLYKKPIDCHGEILYVIFFLLYVYYIFKKKISVQQYTFFPKDLYQCTSLHDTIINTVSNTVDIVYPIQLGRECSNIGPYMFCSSEFIFFFGWSFMFIYSKQKLLLHNLIFFFQIHLFIHAPFTFISHLT